MKLQMMIGLFGAVLVQLAADRVLAVDTIQHSCDDSVEFENYNESHDSINEKGEYFAEGYSEEAGEYMYYGIYDDSGYFEEFGVSESEGVYWRDGDTDNDSSQFESERIIDELVEEMVTNPSETIAIGGGKGMFGKMETNGEVVRRWLGSMKMNEMVLELLIDPMPFAAHTGFNLVLKKDGDFALFKHINNARAKPEPESALLASLLYYEDVHIAGRLLVDGEEQVLMQKVLKPGIDENGAQIVSRIILGDVGQIGDCPRFVNFKVITRSKKDRNRGIYFAKYVFKKGDLNEGFHVVVVAYFHMHPVKLSYVYNE